MNRLKISEWRLLRSKVTVNACSVSNYQYFSSTPMFLFLHHTFMKPSPTYLGLILAASNKIDLFISQGCLPSPQSSPTSMMRSRRHFVRTLFTCYLPAISLSDSPPTTSSATESQNNWQDLVFDWTKHTHLSMTWHRIQQGHWTVQWIEQSGKWLALLWT